MSAVREPDKIYDTVRQFAEFQLAYRECSDTVRRIVDRLIAVVVNENLHKDERLRATMTIIDALFPGKMQDASEEFRNAFEVKSGKVHSHMRADSKLFASRLRECMDRTGVTQSELAKNAGIGQPAVSMMLNRKSRPQKRTIRKFAEALGVDASYLWPGLESEKP